MFTASAPELAPGDKRMSCGEESSTESWGVRAQKWEIDRHTAGLETKSSRGEKISVGFDGLDVRDHSPGGLIFGLA